METKLKSTKFSQKKVISKTKQRDKRNEKFKKFIGNKSEGQGFADKRKRKVQYEYMKFLKKEKLKSTDSQTKVEKKGKESQPKFEKNDIEKYQTNFKRKDRQANEKMSGDQKSRKGELMNKGGPNAYSRASDEQKKRNDERMLKKEQALKTKTERAEALESYQRKKKDNFKKICKKTHKGQPVMKNQIEYLLQKIEKQVNQT